MENTIHINTWIVWVWKIMLNSVSFRQNVWGNHTAVAEIFNTHIFCSTPYDLTLQEATVQSLCFVSVSRYHKGLEDPTIQHGNDVYNVICPY